MGYQYCKSLSLGSILQVKSFQYIALNFLHLPLQVTTFSCSKVKDDKEDGFFYFRYKSIYSVIIHGTYYTKYLV